MRRLVIVVALSCTAAAARAEVGVVTLPTVVTGSGATAAAFQRALDDRLEAAIRRSGRVAKLPGPLTGAELACRDATCMARIAEGAGQGIVLGARVAADRGSPPSYKVSLTRFDRERPGAVKTEESECSVCTEAETGDRLEQMVAQLLPTLVVQPPPVAATPAPTPTPVVTAPARRPISKRLVHAAIGTSAAFGALGIALLGAGGRALYLDGQPTTAILPPATQAPEEYATRGTGLGLTIAGSLLVVSAAVELGVEVWLLRTRAR